MASGGDLGGNGALPAPLEPDIRLLSFSPGPSHQQPQGSPSQGQTQSDQQQGTTPGSHGGSSSGSGIYQTVYSPNPDDLRVMEEIARAFDRMSLDNKKGMLEKFQMSTGQQLYPTQALEEIQSDVEIQLEDVEERAARTQKSMEISDKKVKDFEDLEMVMKLKLTEREKQKKDIKNLEEIRNEETKLVKTRDTLERIFDGKIRKPAEIEERMKHLGEFRETSSTPNYAKVNKHKKAKKVKIEVKENKESHTDSGSEEDQFFDSQEEFLSEKSENKKKKGKKSVTKSKVSMKKSSKSKSKQRVEASEESASTSASNSDEESSTPLEESNTTEEDSNNGDQDERPSMADLANGKYNKKLDRMILQVRRLLSRAGKIKKKTDKPSVERVKTDLNSALALLDKACAEQEDGTSEQWESVEDLGDRIAEEQESNTKKLKKLELDNQRRSQLPKASLDIWNGSPATLQNWIQNMKKTLKFDDPLLNVSSLKKCVGESKEKKAVLKRLQYCQTLEECFTKLNEFYGNFTIALTSMTEKIDKLPHHPESEEVESNNIEEILEYIDQMKAHKKEGEVINEKFVNDYVHKLSKDRSKEILDKKVTSCKDLEFHLKEILKSNKRFTQTIPKAVETKQSQKVKSSQMNSTQVEGEEKTRDWRTVCIFCDGEYGPSDGKHPLWDCQKMSEKGTSVQEAMKIINEKGRCCRCLKMKKHPHRCPAHTLQKHKCYTHNCNRAICKCSFKKKEVQNNSNCVVSDTKDSFVNGVALGSTGFFSESIQIKTNKGGLKSLIINYDTLASHSTGKEDILKSLTEKIEELGVKMKVKTYMGDKTEDAKKCKVTILTENGEKQVEFLVSKDFSNNINKHHYQVPSDWLVKYGLNEKEAAVGGKSYLLLGMDLHDLFPEVLERKNGVAIARSRISGKYLLAGRANTTEEEEAPDLQMNFTMTKRELFNEIETNLGNFEDKKMKKENENSEDQTEKDDEKTSRKKKEERKPVDVATNSTNVEKEEAAIKSMSTDCIDINPFQKCSNCKQCRKCSKLKNTIPRSAEQESLMKIMRENVKFNKETKRYEVSYPHNKLLTELKKNDQEALRMMKILERRLIKAGLTEKFNKSIEKLMKTGVYKPAVEVPEAENLQQSFIVLTYSMHKKSETGEDKLRVCSNSSWHTGDNISFNATCLPTPAYLNLLETVLTRIRLKSWFGFADVEGCYSQLDVSLLDASLRRVWLRPDGMGSDTPWQVFLTVKVNFGDLLGGVVASIGIQDALEEGVDAKLAEEMCDNSVMDDLSTTTNNKEELEENKTTAEEALAKKNLPLKGWTSCHDDAPDTKFLSYIYSSRRDTIRANLKFNISPVRRGARMDPDVKCEAEVDGHVEKHPWTKRKLAGVAAAITHDPLGLLQPTLNGFKFHIRECAELKSDWDTKLPPDLAKKITSTVKLCLKAENLEFPRQALFPEAVEVSVDLYFDGSMSAVGTVVVMKNVFADGKVIYRFLKSKSKLTGKDIVTCPRSELLSAVICVRVFNILVNDLKYFLREYKGKLGFRIIGDSQIVIAQIQKPYYLFKSWVASRLLEIQEVVDQAQQKVQFLHCDGVENFADVNTRFFDKLPSKIPWTSDLTEPTSLKVLKPSKKPLDQFPEIDLKKVTTIQNNFQHVCESVSISDQSDQNESSDVTLKDLLSFAIIQQAAGHHGDDLVDGDEVEEPPDTLESLIDHLLNQFQSYSRIKNTLAYIFHWRIADWGLCQRKAEEKIFEAQQKECQDYMKSFRGNEFKTVTVDRVTYVRGRKTINGPTFLFLVPPNTKLYSVIAASFHRKCHRKGIYTRGLLLRSGYYLPSALHRLKQISNECAFCRRRDQVTLTAEMGPLGAARLGPGPEGGVLHTVQGDVYGPFKIVKDFVNQRAASRRGYVLVMIDEFSRFVVLHPLEGLSKQNLLDALETIFYRYGKITKIRSDWGTNFVSVRQDLAGTEDEIATNEDLLDFTNQMKSRGTVIELKSPHMPWASAGGAEAMNKNISKCMGQVKQSFTAFQFIRFLEKCQFLINERPISLSNTLEVLCPNDISSTHTRIKNVKTLEEFLRKADENVRLFTEKWYDLMFSSLYSQRKWFTTSTVEKGSMVLVLDTRNEFNYPSLGILRDIEEGSDNVERYYMVEHKTRTGQKRTLRRPAQQLSLVLAKSEMGDNSEDEDFDDGDDDEHDEDPGGAPDTLVSDDQPAVPNVIRGPPITPEDLPILRRDHSRESSQDNVANDDRSDEEDQDLANDYNADDDEEEDENVNSIENVETDHESQPSTKDSDGDDIEEDLNVGQFDEVVDNITPSSTLRITIPDRPGVIRNLRKKKPKSRGRKKGKD